MPRTNLCTFCSHRKWVLLGGCWRMEMGRAAVDFFFLCLPVLSSESATCASCLKLAYLPPSENNKHLGSAWLWLLEDFAMLLQFGWCHRWHWNCADLCLELSWLDWSALKILLFCPCSAFLQKTCAYLFPFSLAFLPWIGSVTTICVYSFLY